MPAPPLTPLVLAGRTVRLEPLAREHLDARSCRVMETRANLEAWADEVLTEAAAGRALPFATRLAAGGALVGSTRLAAYAPEHHRIEIGWTFVGRPWQRTAVNTQAKRFMLAHAFETLGLGRVELKTDRLNEASWCALLRLGAQEEGVLRAHVHGPSGHVRDTVYYSILAQEWPAVRAALDARLARGPGAADPGGRE